MKRLKNKGFAISTMLYGMLVIILLLLTLIVNIMAYNRKSSKDLSDEIINHLEGSSYSQGVYTASIEVKNPNIINVYKYNEDSKKCLGGEETDCKELNKKSINSYKPYNIVKYKVNDNEELYFNILYVSDNKVIMQQRENTIYETMWTNDTNYGNLRPPSTLIDALDNATSSWKNVNNQTYTLGTTEFGAGAFKTNKTSCSYTQGALLNASLCSLSGYNTATYTNKKARIITAQEAGEMGCKFSKTGGNTNMSCKKFMYNYLYQSTSYGGTVEDDYHTASDHNYGYWTSSVSNEDPYVAIRFNRMGSMDLGDIFARTFGARAVVEINLNI